jgi:hypothetical protein
MNARRPFLLPLLILLATSSATAKAWRGIEPLRSNRSDVIKSVNQCSDQREACVFTIDNEDIYIGFLAGLTAENIHCLGEVPPDTVMFIESRPHSTDGFRDFQFEKREFTKSRLDGFSWRLRRPAKFDVYISEKQGFAVKSTDGKVVQAVYLPSSSEIGQCRSYYGTLDDYTYISEAHVPTSAAGCPQTAFDQEQITVVVTTNVPTRTGFLWKISDGKIVAGQYTQMIRIDTTGLAGKTIKVSVGVTDRDQGITASSECGINVLKKP